MNFSKDPLNNLENLYAKNKFKSLSIYLVVILVIFGFLACLPIIELDISSQSRGILRPNKENIPVNSIVYGKVVYANLVNNQNVSIGDTLLKISQGNLKAQKSLNDSILIITETKLKDIVQLLSDQTENFKDKTTIDNFKSYKSRKKELETRLNKASITYNRYNILYKKHVIGRAEYESHLYNMRFAKDALNSFVKEQQSNWQQQKQDLEVQIQNLESKREQYKFDAENYTVIAPISGTLEKVLGLQIGSLVNSSQILGIISPKGNLIIENTVTPNDIGLLKKGQKVQFQLDAFNYNQWGMLEGEIIDIDKNVTLQENIAFFKVRCSLYSNTLQLKNGYQTKVSKGMTLSTHYFITRRSLSDLLFDKMDDWINPKVK